MSRILPPATTVIETPRLRLRPYRPGDGVIFAPICVRNRDHLWPYEGDNPVRRVNTVAEAELLVRDFADAWANGHAFFLGGWLKAGGGFACQIYIGPVNWALPEFAVGYWADAGCQGQGYVTEAVQAALHFCFGPLGAVRLRLECNELNLRSRAVAERCGFVLEGHRRETHPELPRPDGLPSGDLLFGLLRRESGAAPGALT